MTDWTAGYVADIGYSSGYYTELNPQRFRLAFLNAGIVAPKVQTACELGFGQGVSVNIHAGASAASWYGTDFNPAQAGFAQELAAVSGAGARLHDDAFAEFCVREDLPDFNFIALHGIWSWISDDNRATIVDFLRRKLKVGGVLYIGYNTQPGWADMVPVRELLTEHAAVLAAQGTGTVNRIEEALKFADTLFAANPAYARDNQNVLKRLQELKGQDRNYLAHEYFNRDWLPMSFSRVAAWLGSAKLDFACSANYLDHVDIMNLTSEQQALLKSIPNPMFRQMVRDFCVNQQFRKDYWVKGARQLSVLERAEALLAERVVLVRPRSDVSLKVKTGLGDALLHEEIYGPLLDALADNQPKSIGQLMEVMAGKADLNKVVQGILVLTGSGSVHPVQDDADVDNIRPQCERINAYMMNKARSSADISCLASPVTGGGVSVGRIDQLFLLAERQGRRSPEEWVQYAWKILSVQGHRLIKEGQLLETAEANLEELHIQSREFAGKRLAVYKALQIT